MRRLGERLPEGQRGGEEADEDYVDGKKLKSWNVEEGRSEKGKKMSQEVQPPLKKKHRVKEAIKSELRRPKDEQKVEDQGLRMRKSKKDDEEDFAARRSTMGEEMKERGRQASQSG